MPTHSPYRRIVEMGSLFGECLHPGRCGKSLPKKQIHRSSDTCETQQEKLRNSNSCSTRIIHKKRFLNVLSPTLGILARLTYVEICYCWLGEHTESISLAKTFWVPQDLWWDKASFGKTWHWDCKLLFHTHVRFTKGERQNSFNSMQKSVRRLKFQHLKQDHLCELFLFS